MHQGIKIKNKTPILTLLCEGDPRFEGDMLQALQPKPRQNPARGDLVRVRVTNRVLDCQNIHLRSVSRLQINRRELPKQKAHSILRQPCERSWMLRSVSWPL